MQKNFASAVGPRGVPSTYVGNVWLGAATIVLALLSEHQTGPHILVLEADGGLQASPPDHPEYERRLLSQGFVCTVTPGMAPERLAARLRDAAVRNSPV